MHLAALHAPLLASDVPLARLAANSTLPQPAKLGEACRQFEALLLRQILQQTRRCVIPSEFTHDTFTTEIYQDLVNEQLADSMSRSGGLGLAKALQAQLGPHPHPHPPAPPNTPPGPATAPRHD
jgi:Rod binding domain-containing protein